jgi:phosphohistidine phosphatase
MNTINMKTSKTLTAFKNIIIWRHAEAHPALAQGEDEFLMQSGQRDLARMLTPKGKQQAKRMANWLNERLPKDTLLLSSPAMRAFQTAQALKGEVKVVEALNPSANLQQVLAVLAGFETSTQNILLVGHQPWLWQLVAHLTSFTAQEISIKKGAVWWLRLSVDELDAHATRYNIVAVQSPSLLD